MSERAELTKLGTGAWLHNFRRLRIHYERRPELHLAFMQLGCAVVCQRSLTS